MEFNDLHGIMNDNTNIELTFDEIDALGDALQGMEFDDLKVLSDS